MFSSLQPYLYELSRLLLKPTYDHFQLVAEQLNIKSGVKDIVDLGMGTGQLTPYFQNLNYFGIDVEKDNVLRAEEKYPDMKFYCTSMTDLSSVLKEESMDLACILGALHHMTEEDISQTLDQLKNILRKSGKLFIIEAEPPLSQLNFFGKFVRRMDKGAYIRDFKQNKSLLESNGWQIKESGVFSKQLLDFSYFLAYR